MSAKTSWHFQSLLGPIIKWRKAPIPSRSEHTVHRTSQTSVRLGRTELRIAPCYAVFIWNRELSKVKFSTKELAMAAFWWTEQPVRSLLCKGTGLFWEHIGRFTKLLFAFFRECFRENTHFLLRIVKTAGDIWGEFQVDAVLDCNPACPPGL